MAIKKIRRKSIKVSPDTRKRLAKEFNLSVQSIGNALRYRTEGWQPDKIRQRALDLGGIESIDIKMIDC